SHPARRHELDGALVSRRKRGADPGVGDVLVSAAAPVGPEDGPKCLELRQRQLPGAASVEKLKARDRGLPKFREANASVQVGVGRGNRLGQVEQAVPRGALKRSGNMRGLVVVGERMVEMAVLAAAVRSAEHAVARRG